MLDKEQQKIIEDSLWVVNAVLKEQNLQNDKDMRQDACLYLCKCLERFNTDFGVKWTTYAYKSIFLYVKRKYAKAKQKEKLLVNEEMLFNLSSNEEIEKDFQNRHTINEIKKQLTPKEIEVLDLLYKGYSRREVTTMLSISPQKIRELFNKIKEKCIII